MVTVLQIAGLSVTAVLIAKLLRRYAEEQALLLTLLVSVALTATAVTAMTPILNEINDMLIAGGLSPDQTVCIAKSAGICIVTQLASDICRDGGESAASSAVILAGKIALMLLVVPLLEPLLSIIREVLSCVSGFGAS
ncbi:MAG: stage III sporulation AC/AD family protein [Oscillospiraceae bacterium]|nr:stage III sporulation AC/AD family protein [Oscillospiraceae bacterium]